MKIQTRRQQQHLPMPHLTQRLHKRHKLVMEPKQAQKVKQLDHQILWQLHQIRQMIEMRQVKGIQGK